MHPLSAQTLMLLRKLQQKGNFVNFKEFIVNNDEQEILDGAMKIKCKKKDESLAIRARIVRRNDFLSMTEHIRERDMVSILTFSILHFNI